MTVAIFKLFPSHLLPAIRTSQNLVQLRMCQLCLDALSDPSPVILPSSPCA